ncbi:bacterioferritin-associated ferredoxin [Streptomyces sp. NPDC050560]|uniref:bacterioferritin-associated ferredoxin n=1 Tax=Streptomyces sp. NPDC050560 TaxID=3365630 RepID=UPI0037B4BBD2
MFVCNCFGVTEAQVRRHAADGADSPRRIASACKAGTDCGSCVRRIQALLGRLACPAHPAPDEAPAVTGAPSGREAAVVLAAVGRARGESLDEAA